MQTPQTLRPADAPQVHEIVAEALAHGTPLEIRAGGSKRDIGKPNRAATLVDVTALSGIVDYEPSELVLTLRPATPLAEVETLLAANGQMLAFEPWDHGPLLGQPAGAATVGGIVAAGVAGSRRVTAGGARDHLLGFTAVSGRGEDFKGGGKVVKNVTGYDLAKVMAGSWGQLTVLTELSLKVMPRPRAAVTVALRGLSAETAVAAMSRALGSPCAPAAAAHLPATAGSPATTLLRLEGFRESVDVRAPQLLPLLASFGEAALLEEAEGETLWTDIRDVRPAAAAETLWRIQLAPSRAAALTGALDRCQATWFCDWGGALVWVGAPAGADIRGAAQAHGGHATLVRAPLAVREAVPVRHPQAAGLAALEARVKQTFDPAGILDPSRFI